MSANPAVSTAAPPTSKVWNVSLWVIQVALAVMFGIAGVMKTTTPIPQLAEKLPWVAAVPEGLVRFIGVSELAGALGLLLPSLTRVQPKLTALAALGLVVVMVLASGFHVSRGELSVLPINFAIGALAGFVAWGRGRKAPISPR